MSREENALNLAIIALTGVTIFRDIRKLNMTASEAPATNVSEMRSNARLNFSLMMSDTFPHSRLKLTESLVTSVTVLSEIESKSDVFTFNAFINFGDSALILIISGARSSISSMFFRMFSISMRFESKESGATEYSSYVSSVVLE